MENVTKEAVENAIQNIFKNNNSSEININELIYSLIEKFNPQSEFSQEQKDRLGEYVFFHPDVIQQLAQSEQEARDGDISNYTEYLKFKNEVFRGI